MVNMDSVEMDRFAGELIAWIERTQPDERQFAQELRDIAAGDGGGTAAEMALVHAVEAGAILPEPLLGEARRFADAVGDPDTAEIIADLTRLALAA